MTNICKVLKNFLASYFWKSTSDYFSHILTDFYFPINNDQNPKATSTNKGSKQYSG